MLRTPAQQGMRQRRVGIASGHVARAAGLDLVRHVAAAGGREGSHHVEHAATAPGAQVHGQRAGVVEQPLQRGDVALRQVADVDVVAHASAVVGGVVVAVHGQPGPPAHGHLRYERHQVVGHPARVFADQAAAVRAHRVEVAQHGGPPQRVGLAQVLQHLLAHQLGLTVRVGGGQRGRFGNGQRLRVAIHRGAAAEDEALHALLLHGRAHGEQAAQVVGVVGQRLCGGFAHGLERCKVHRGVDAVALQQRGHGRRVADVGFLKNRCLATQGLQALQDVRRAVGKVVHAHHLKASGPQREPGVRRDVAGGASEQDGGFAA